MNIQKLIIDTVQTDWKDLLLDYPKWDVVSNQLSAEYAAAGNSIYPAPEKIFRCFNYFAMADTKVVIIGQDCYHTPGVANGLAFATDPGRRVPPSLKNIYAEIQRDYPAYEIPVTGDLEEWARQGVLLVNMALTVRKGTPGSHSSIWQSFSTSLSREITKRTENVVFMLWGNAARSRAPIIEANMGEDQGKHCILEAGHPSPFSVRHFAHCNHFAKANAWLRARGREQIQW